MKKTLAGLFFVTCSLFGTTLEEYNEFIKNEKIPWFKQVAICEREAIVNPKYGNAGECLKAANMALNLKGKKLGDLENNKIQSIYGSIERIVGVCFSNAGAIYIANEDYGNALKSNEKAIEYGLKNGNIVYNIGVIYYNRTGGFKNDIEAYKYLKEALELGHPEAQAAIQTLCSQSPWACK